MGLFKKDRTEELLAALLESQVNNTKESIFAPAQLLKVMILGVIAAVAALVWSSVTTLPLQNADTFSTIQQQNAEIKTTVLEMKNQLSDLSTKLDATQKQSADQQAKIARVETLTSQNKDSINQLNDRVGQLERKDRGFPPRY